MHKRVGAGALACAMLVFAPRGFAQQATQHVTLPQALAAARENVDVSLSQRALATARADVLAADHPIAPVASAKAASIDLENGIGGGNLLRNKRIDKSIGLDMTVERGGKRMLRTLAAQSAADAAGAELRETRVQQQLAAAAAFYDLLAAQLRVSQVQELATSANQLADTSQRRQRAGEASLQEVARTAIEAERTRADLRGAEADRARASLVLAALLGSSVPVAAEGDWPSLASSTADIDAEADATSIDARGDVQAATRRVQAAQAAFEGAQALRRNDVTVGGSLDHFPGTSRRQLELRVSMPLAGVLGTYGYEGEIARARAQLDVAEDQLRKVRAAAAIDRQRMRSDLAASAARARSYDDAIVPRARDVARMSELAYSRGATSLGDLIDARRTLRGVLLEEVAARSEHAKALAAWRLRARNADD